MAKMYYSLQEAAEKLGLTVDELKDQIVLKGKLREFREGATPLYSISDVDALKETMAKEKQGSEKGQSKQIEIPVVTRIKDDQAGGFIIYIHKDNDEMLAEFDDDLSEEEKQEILNEEDPYENGYLGTGTIVIEVNEDGTACLAKTLRFHAGQ